MKKHLTGNVKTTTLKKRRRSITRLPDWLVRIKGWFYARRGKGACDAEIDRLRQRCFTVEHSMCSELEGAIIQLHVDSSLFQLKAAGKAEKPASPPDDASPIDLRAANSAKARYEAEINASKSAKESIIKIHEELISAEHCFYQDVEQLRNYTTAKIDAFITGIRTRKKAELSDYRMNDDVAFDGTAYSDYRKVHEANDRAREAFLEKLKEVQ